MTDPDPATTHAGGCLCGAIRFAARGEPDWVMHCHCASCRRQTASMLATFAGYTTQTFRFTHGEPGRFESSPGVVRKFCRDCGTPLTYEANWCPDEVHIHLCALDDPAAMPAQGHVFAAEKVPWFHLGDDLPQYQGTSRGPEGGPNTA